MNNPETILIIGASSGVGKSLLRKLYLKDNMIYTISRRKIENNYDKTKCIQCDISHYSTLFEALSMIKQQAKNIDRIINCVGVGYFAPLNKNYSGYWQQILNTNILGLVNLLSCMQQLDSPSKQFIHVGSLAAYRVSKTVGNLVYSSSKTAALPLIAEYRKNLRIQGKHTKVTLFTPGFIEGTDFETNFFISEPNQKNSLYSKFKGLSPDDVVNSIIYTMNLPDHVEINEIIIRPTEQED